MLLGGDGVPRWLSGIVGRRENHSLAQRTFSALGDIGLSLGRPAPLPGMGRLEGDGAVIGRKYAPVAMMECSERQEDATNLRRLGQRYCVPSFGAPGSRYRNWLPTCARACRRISTRLRQRAGGGGASLHHCHSVPPVIWPQQQQQQQLLNGSFPKCASPTDTLCQAGESALGGRGGDGVES